MAELCEDGVEDDAAIGIILGAQDCEVPCYDDLYARRRLLAICFGDNDSRLDREAEGRSLAIGARDGEVAAHPLCERLHDHKPKPGAAIAPRDVGIGLRERAKQSVNLGGLEPDTRVADQKYQRHPAAL